MRLTKLLGSVLSALQVRTQSALLNESTLGTLLGSDGSWFETNIWTTAVIPCLPSDSASDSLYIFVISMYSSARANNDAWQQQSPCIIERWCMAATASMHHRKMMHGNECVRASFVWGPAMLVLKFLSSVLVGLQSSSWSFGSRSFRANLLRRARLASAKACIWRTCGHGWMLPAPTCIISRGGGSRNRLGTHVTNVPASWRDPPFVCARRFCMYI